MDPNDPYGYGQGNVPLALRRAHVTNTGISLWPFFVGGEGIEHRVIQTDICRYLGSDARVIRSKYEGVDGYYYNAYRTFTDHMIDSLREDSARWWEERQLNNGSGTYRNNPSPSTKRPLRETSCLCSQ